MSTDSLQVLTGDIQGVQSRQVPNDREGDGSPPPPFSPT